MDRSSVTYGPLKGREDPESIPVETDFKPTTKRRPTQVPAGVKPPEFGRGADEVFQERVEAAAAAQERALDWAGITSRKLTRLSAEVPPSPERAVGNGHREVAYRWISTRGVREELTQTQRKVEALEADLLLHEQARQLASVAAATSELGLFILHKIGHSEEALPVDEVAANLEGPEGWLAVARLMKAGLIDENGRSFYLTLEGDQFLEGMPDGLA